MGGRNPYGPPGRRLRKYLRSRMREGIIIIGDLAIDECGELIRGWRITDRGRYSGSVVIERFDVDRFTVLSSFCGFFIICCQVEIWGLAAWLLGDGSFCIVGCENRDLVTWAWFFSHLFGFLLGLSQCYG